MVIDLRALVVCHGTTVHSREQLRESTFPHDIRVLQHIAVRIGARSFLCKTGAANDPVLIAEDTINYLCVRIRQIKDPCCLIARQAELSNQDKYLKAQGITDIDLVFAWFPDLLWFCKHDQCLELFRH